MKIGDKVIYRQGKSRSKDVLPLGIENCEVVQFGTGPSGEECAQINLPTFFAERLGVQNPVWVIAADLDA